MKAILEPECVVSPPVARHTALRHRRVWLHPALQGPDVLSTDPRAIDAILGWHRDGLPFVGRATAARDPAGHVPLGLAVVLDAGRARLSFSVASRWVSRIDEPIPLEDLLATLPLHMRATAGGLADVARALGMPLGAYGSVAWEHARPGYLHAGSDLDLLARPGSAAIARQWLLAVETFDAKAPMRIDGEVQLPDGASIAWRELAGDGARMLAKTDAGPVLRSKDEVWTSWDQERPTC